jgi:hypothetical protein
MLRGTGGTMQKAIALLGALYLASAALAQNSGHTKLQPQ